MDHLDVTVVLDNAELKPDIPKAITVCYLLEGIKLAGKVLRPVSFIYFSSALHSDEDEISHIRTNLKKRGGMSVYST